MAPRDSGRSRASTAPLSSRSGFEPQFNSAPAGSRIDQIIWREPASLVPYERNSRSHSDEQIRQIRASIERFGFTNPILLREDGRSIGAGHGRQLASLLDPPLQAVPTLIVAGLSDAEWRALIIADNKLALNAGWNEDLLKLELADLSAEGFDMPLIGFDVSELADLGIGSPLIAAGGDEVGDIDSNVPEDARATAWRMWAAELAAQIRALEPLGYARQGISPGYALGCFLAAVHDGAEYPRICQLAFHSDVYSIAGAQQSILAGLDSVAAGETNWQRLEFVCGGAMNAAKILYSPLPMGGGARMALDFPASLARDLIDEFAAGGAVCDPCHGWGGRLIGFMLSKAKYYAGTDPAPSTHRGLCRIRDLFAQHSGREQGIELFNKPAEKWNPPKPPLKGDGFDLVLTSPPYFDVEKYEGGDQSRLKHGDYASWRDGFYAELIRRAHRWLNPGGTFALQVGSQTYPLLADGRELAKAAGFNVIGIRSTDMVNNFTNTAEEDGEIVLLLRKKRR
jgi:hypothetical protein